MQSLGKKLKVKLRIKSPWLREALAEFLGTYLFMALGEGALAQYTFANNPTISSYINPNIAWGLAVGMGIYVAGGVSGGHLNPAVSVAFAMIGRLEWKKVPAYCIAQYLGGFFAAASVFGVYKDALYAFEGNNRTMISAGVFATYPRDHLQTQTAFGDQILGTALMMICIMAVIDEKNTGAPKGLAPFVLGFVITVMGLSYAFNCGYPINPARDVGPRIFTALAGWGPKVFTFGNYHFWIPIVGPHLGAILGMYAYLLFVGIHIPDDDEEEEAEEDEKPPISYNLTEYRHGDLVNKNHL